MKQWSMLLSAMHEWRPPKKPLKRQLGARARLLGVRRWQHGCCQRSDKHEGEITLIYHILEQDCREAIAV